MAWTAPKIQALLLRMPKLPHSSMTVTARNTPATYGASPSTVAHEQQSGVQKSGRY